MEGFPYKCDELRYVAEKGWYPDVAVILQVYKFSCKDHWAIKNNLQVQENNAINRLLPTRISAWKIKRDKRIAKRKQQRDKTMQDWVRVFVDVHSHN